MRRIKPGAISSWAGLTKEDVVCGRFAFNFTWGEIHALLGLTGDVGAVSGFSGRRFNAAPTQVLSVAVERDGGRVLEGMEWGFVPSWGRDDSRVPRLINARSETVGEKPAFREAYRRRRCLVPASGFYEWKGAGKGAGKGGRKQPYYIHLRSGEGFAMAGLWEGRGASGSFTILTTRANDVVGALHDRMPVIVPRGSYGRWLGSGDSSGLGDLLEPFDAGLMAAYPVSTRVGSPANDDASLIEAIEVGDGAGAGDVAGLFG